MQIVTGYTAQARMLAALETATSFDDLTCHLFKEAVEITPDTVIADFVEADYNTYVAQAVANTGTIYLTPSGVIVWEAADLVFQPTDALAPNIIYGYWLEGTMGGTGTRFVSGASFDDPVSLATVLDALFVRPRIVLGQPGFPF